MENKEKRVHLVKDFYYGQDGSLYRIEGKEDKNGDTYAVTSKIANHTPILQEIRNVDNGIEIVEEVIFYPLRNYRKGVPVALTVKDILGQHPTEKFGVTCYVEEGKGYINLYRKSMQNQCENAPVSMVYQHTGYTVIDGERIFLNGGYSITKDGLTDKHNVVLEGETESYCFVESRNSERFETLLTLLPSVAPVPLIYAGLGISFLTPLNAMLRECGIEPQFILYFTGKTGSRKTTMAKLFLNFFGKFNNGTAPTASFRDTANAIEKKFAVTDSTLVLLDDRIPSTTQKIKSQMEQVEQSVARMIGDRSGRARMNADGTLKATYRPKCNLIITAEESFSNVGESAIARSVSVDMKPGDIDLSKLTEVQQKAEHLNQCMGDYIRYVISNWDNIAERIAPLFMEYRNKAQNGGHGRLAECVAHLQIGITLMCEWLISESVITEGQATKMKESAWAVFMELAEKQNRRIVEEKPVKLFLDAVKEMRDRGTIRIVDMDNPGEFTSSNVVGYMDSNYYYFYPDGIYSAVKNFYSLQDKNYPLGKLALFQQLAIDGLIETDKEQNTKTKRIKDGKRPRFLWLRAIALNDEKEEEL